VSRLPAEKHSSNEARHQICEAKLCPSFGSAIFLNAVAQHCSRKNHVVEYHGGRAGLAADELLGEQQAVIKAAGSAVQGIPGVSGSTILGNGRVALILDVRRFVPRQSIAAPN